MINLDKLTKSRLKNIYVGAEYEALKMLAKVLISELRSKSAKKATQWQLITDAMDRDGRVEGIKQFLNAIKAVADKENEETRGK